MHTTNQHAEIDIPTSWLGAEKWLQSDSVPTAMRICGDADANVPCMTVLSHETRANAPFEVKHMCQSLTSNKRCVPGGGEGGGVWVATAAVAAPMVGRRRPRTR